MLKSKTNENAAKSPQPATAGAPEKRHFMPVIEISDAYKYYGRCGHKNLVLQKFNMTAYSGEIYSLLGPKGCGKSTVIDVVLGMKSLNRGEVQIFGFPPGHELSGIPGIRVGYAPANHGLYESLTINELLRFYASVLGLTDAYIDERILFVSSLLMLPNEAIHVGYCNEGMKRQVSFAIALLHEPEVLILDEPTEGLDPVLRKNFWNHLQKLARDEEKTVFVTTRSFIEAKESGRVGIIRNGHVLVEGTPRDLLSFYKESRMENIYIRIYSLNIKQIHTTRSLDENPLIKLEPVNTVGSEGFIYVEKTEDGGTSLEQEQLKQLEELQKKKRKFGVFGRPYNLRTICSPNKRLWMVVLKDLRCLYRHYLTLFLLLFLPLLFLIIFGCTIGGRPTKLPVAVVNKEVSDCKLNYTTFMSCQILSLINKNYIVQYRFEDEEKARAALHNSEVYAMILIEPLFSTALQRYLLSQRLDLLAPLTKYAHIHLIVHVSSKIISTSIQEDVDNAFSLYIDKATESTKYQKVSMSMIKVEDSLFNKDKASETEYLLLGLTSTIIYHLSAFVAAISLVKDRITGVYQRDYLAGVRLCEIIVSMLIAYGFILFLEACLMYLIILFVFVTNNGNPALLVPLVIAQIWCGLSFGLLISNLVMSRVSAGVIIFCSFLISLMLCGILWPMESQTIWLKVILQYLPPSLPAMASRMVILLGAPFTHRIVYVSLLISLSYTACFVIISVFINKVSY